MSNPLQLLNGYSAQVTPGKDYTGLGGKKLPGKFTLPQRMLSKMEPASTPIMHGISLLGLEPPSWHPYILILGLALRHFQECTQCCLAESQQGACCCSSSTLNCCPGTSLGPSLSTLLRFQCLSGLTVHTLTFSVSLQPLAKHRFSFVVSFPFPRHVNTFSDL